MKNNTKAYIFSVAIGLSFSLVGLQMNSLVGTVISALGWAIGITTQVIVGRRERKKLSASLTSKGEA